MTKYSPIEIDEQHIDMQAALAQGRVYVHTSGEHCYAVLSDAYAEDFGTSYVGDVWLVDSHGRKADETYPSPIPIRKEALQELSEYPALQHTLDVLYPSANRNANPVVLLTDFVTQKQADLSQRGLRREAEMLGQVKSYLDRFGLPSAENQMALLHALNRTTEAVRKVFRATCEQKPFPKGSECDDKLQALCEGDIALKTVGHRDTVWTAEKANVALRQGWKIEPSTDGTMGLTIKAVPGSRLASDIDAYAFVCEQAKVGDLLALTACKEAGIQIAAVNDYRPPVLGM